MPRKLYRPVVGQRFGRLTVISTEIDCQISERSRVYRWMVRCDCGNERWVQHPALRNGLTISCGCWAREKIRATGTRHGMHASPEYRAWKSLRERCTDPRSKSYPSYGGRGITVCPEWGASFDAFYQDMGPRPSPQHSIDRIDNDGPYSRGNCRWATKKEQSRNHRKNRLITHAGRTMPLAAWADEAGISWAAMVGRMKRGWSMEQALDPRYAPLRPGVNAMTGRR
jgi:hypothetical protein